MKTQKEIIRWLQANLGKRCVAGLTSTDTYALVASTNLSNLISYDTAPSELFQAYAAIVRQMQDHTRHLAFHAIACELDWSHRAMIWSCAGLVNEIPTSKCEGESR
jgi:hypothetical protein